MRRWRTPYRESTLDITSAMRQKWDYSKVARLETTSLEARCVQTGERRVIRASRRYAVVRSGDLRSQFGLTLEAQVARPSGVDREAVHSPTLTCEMEFR